MENRRRVQYWLSLILPLILAGVLLVACDAGEEEGGGGGLDDQTPLFDETPLVDETAVVPGQETPMIEPTPLVDETPMVEETEPVETEPAVEMTATAEIPPTEETEATREVDVEGQAMVAMASNLLGRNIQDESGTNVGVIDELLADDSGAIQYVIVDAVFVEGTVTDDVDDTTPEATAEGALQDDGQMVDNTIALSWDALETRQGMLTDGEVDVDSDPDAYHLVYVDSTALDQQQTFDRAILDEQGAILDDQAVTDTELEIPSEFANLIQVSEYNNVDLRNTAGEDLGEIEDALIDLREGHIQYVIVDVGGFLGIGERSIAVPFDQFQIDVTVEGDAEEESVTLDADQERLENAPEIDRSVDWVPNVDVDWDAEWSAFWNADVDVDTNDTNG